jgi:KUP system potassium uptake protein
VAGAVFTIMSTWHKGRKLVAAHLHAAEVPLDAFFQRLAAEPPARVPGTAVFMTGRPQGAPPILVHHLKHNKALHERVILLTVTVLDTPTAVDTSRLEVETLFDGFHRVIARYGFMETPDVPEALASSGLHGVEWRDDDTTYYLADLTLIANARIGMSAWRDKLFIFLSHNARRATNFFHIPPDRVVEIGIQLEI